MNKAIARALEEAASLLEQKGVLVVAHLEATYRFERAPPALTQALYTIFRGLAERLSEGATLYVATTDRAGGDIEVTWEAKEPPAAKEDAQVRDIVRHGPYGDLIELALVGLESICRVRTTHRAQDVPPPESGTALRFLPTVRRRYTFLLPDPERYRHKLQ